MKWKWIMGARILLIEDRPEISLVLQEILIDQGFITDVVGSGREALEFVRQTAYDLLITDLELPDINGLTVIEQCMQISPDIRVLFITGYQELMEMARSKIGKHCQIIEKPCRPQKIIDMVNQLLA
ncbi:MAG: response regulator [Calditrichaeota bacterium]|nr:MAG: response regulator [Calditrichota bacterium]